MLTPPPPPPPPPGPATLTFSFILLSVSPRPAPPPSPMPGVPPPSRSGLLKTLAHRLYSTTMSCPFPLIGSCRALIYRDHGIPSDVSTMNILLRREAGIEKGLTHVCKFIRFV